jgi:hypothetical protein
MVMADQNDRGGNQDNNGGGRRNPADNLTREDRIRGGERSAKMQQRDQRGQFAGRKGQASESNRAGDNNRQMQENSRGGNR